MASRGRCSLAACGRSEQARTGGSAPGNRGRMPVPGSRLGVTPMARAGRGPRLPQQAQRDRPRYHAEARPVGPGRTTPSCACARARHRAVGEREVDRRVRPARRAAPRRELAAGVLGLALQGIAVAQRRRAPGLRRLAQELRDDISGGPGAPAAPVASSNRSSAQEIGARRDLSAGGRDCRVRPRRKRRRRPLRQASAERRRPTTPHKSARGTLTAPSEARWSVMNWQSSKRVAAAFRRATSQASATFDASVARLNMLSPKKARPS